MKQLCVFVLTTLVYASSAYAGDNVIWFDNYYSEGEYGAARLMYNYTYDGHHGVVIRVGLNVQAQFQPIIGTLQTIYDGTTDTRQIMFSVTEPDGPTPSFMRNLRGYDNTQTIYLLKEPGLYDFHFKFTDGDSEVYASSYHKFPMFDTSALICRLGRKTIALDYAFWSLDELPDMVDLIKIELMDGSTIEFENVPFERTTGGFGWVNIPVKKKDYKKQLAGKKLLTLFTIGDEGMSMPVLYPHVAQVSSTCVRG